MFLFPKSNDRGIIRACSDQLVPGAGKGQELGCPAQRDPSGRGVSGQWACPGMKSCSYIWKWLRLWEFPQWFWSEAYITDSYEHLLHMLCMWWLSVISRVKNTCSFIHLFPSVMFYWTTPSHIVSHSFILSPVSSQSSHYSLTASSKLTGSRKERAARCAHVTLLTHSSSNPGSNFAGTQNQPLRRHRRHP